MMTKKVGIILLIPAFFLLSCSEKKREEFSEIFRQKDAAESGITFANELKESAVLNIVEYLYYYNGGGVAVGDINGDGLEDLYFTGNQVQDRLYLNKGNLKFEDITGSAGILPANSWSTGVTMDDVNGDGYLDIYVCKAAILSADTTVHNLLYINNGDGSFTEKAAEYGLNFRGLSTQAAFLDYDLDGDLDMYLLNHNIHTINSYGPVEKRKSTDPYAGDLFFENRLKEEGRFVDVTQKCGIYNSPLGYGLAVTVEDINDDGWTDIYVGNDFHENDYVYLNNGNKTFTESVAKLMSHTSQFSMGVDIADVNNDTRVDIFTTDMLPDDEKVLLVSAGEDSDQVKLVKKDFGYEPQKARNHFLLNMGTGTFGDIAYMTRTFATDWSWAVLIQDFDNDTRPDIFVTNGIVRRPNDLDYISFLNEMDNKNPASVPDRTRKLIEKMPSQPLKNRLFLQEDKLSFQSFEIGKASFSNGAAYADLDNDGDLDLVVNNINEKAGLFENITTGKNFLSFDFSQNKGHTTKGTKVMVYADGVQFRKSLQTTKGFQSSVSHVLHFGLGNTTTVDSVLIIWPDNTIQLLSVPEINRKLTVKREDTGLRKFAGNAPVTNPYKLSVLPFRHEENNYQDQNQEKLIPERLSYEGPAFLYEDFDGDGIKDIFLGGGRNQPAQLYLGAANGAFNKKILPDFERDAAYEDVSAALLDFDGDGDRDLYVVSGGSDNKELDKILEDRIYLNNGNGVFKRLPLSLPHTNGSVVAVADFDKDGYEDIFVGARSIPGFYGLSPYSFILRNKKGQGVEIAYKERYGMVTDAVWTDLNGDGYPDLVMCGDWMEILILENDGTGVLTEKTSEYGLAGKKGLWSCIALADLNEDGRPDIIAGNAGLNFKWNASDSMPVKMYVGDFDKNGATEPLIFYHYLRRYIPFAPMSQLISQLPVLRKKFTDYGSFRNVQGVGDLFENYKENLVEEKQLTELRSMVFLSEGSAFRAVPLGFYEQSGDITHIWIDSEKNVFYVGSSREFVSEMGAANANKGRKLSGFDKNTGTFARSESLGLPVSIKPKKIVSGPSGRYYIPANNGWVYVIQQ